MVVPSAQAKLSASITHLLKKRQRLHCYGTPRRIIQYLRNKSRSPATSGPTGSAALACMNGRPQFWLRRVTSLGAPSAPRHMPAGKQMVHGRSTLLFQRQSVPCWSSGIMTETGKMATSLTTQHCAVPSSFGGDAMNAQRARCTAGRLLHTVEPGKAEG